MAFRDYTSSSDGTDDTDKAERLYVGYIKWDGCSDYDSPDSEGLQHACGNPGRKIKAIWDTLYSKAAELMPEHEYYLLEKPAAKESEGGK